MSILKSYFGPRRQRRFFGATLGCWLGLAASAAGCAAVGKGNTDLVRHEDDGGVITSGGSGPMLDVDPDAGPTELTCADVLSAKSYLGCEFWPTVTLNPTWSIFDFAAVVANVGSQPALVEVEGPNGPVPSATVPPGGLVKLYLPWVPALKGEDSDTCGNTPLVKASIFAAKGAFHLTSSRPVIVNQFNALEFRGVGGAAKKSWDSCPGRLACGDGGPLGCFSFSNDAAILLPVTALTGNYRITSMPADSAQSFFTITATKDATNVAVSLSATAKILGGAPLLAAGPGDTVEFSLNAGDAMEVVSVDATVDLGGSLVKADQPVQVIAGAACAALPTITEAGAVTSCDHLEETVLPAETLGRRYVVPLPTGALGKPASHMVRLFGNVNGTKLSYPGGAPPSAPTRLDAGQVVDLGTVKKDFEVEADHEFAVGTFMLSAGVADADDIIGRGDPSQSQAITVDQYRTEYVFLAPDDYDVNYVDVVMPLDAQVILDGHPMPGRPIAIGRGELGIARVRLGPGDHGAHTLSSDKPVGLQVIGYGSYTSYQYPGGLDLKPIAPPPPK